jgi:hypothetical protein
VRCGLISSSQGLRCVASRLFDGDTRRFGGEVIDTFSVGESGVLGDIGDGDDTEPGPPEDPGEAPNNPSRVFLPLLSR